MTQDEACDAPSASDDDSGNSNRIMNDWESSEKPSTFDASEYYIIPMVPNLLLGVGMLIEILISTPQFIGRMFHSRA